MLCVTCVTYNVITWKKQNEIYELYFNYIIDYSNWFSYV